MEQREAGSVAVCRPDALNRAQSGAAACAPVRLRYSRPVYRALALLLLIVALVPGTWWRVTGPRPPSRLNLQIVPVERPSRNSQRQHLGPFELTGAWVLKSPHYGFGGFSALVWLGDGRLLALSDRGNMLAFSVPGARQRPARLDRTFSRLIKQKGSRDFEAAAFDPGTNTIWASLENYNVIARLHLRRGSPRLSGLGAPGAMAFWPSNSGPEAMVRLDSGRFLILSEAAEDAFRDVIHPAFYIDGDPVDVPDGGKLFSMQGIEGFSPTDMAQVPDGRVLILMRRAVWPFPARFAGRLAIADPGQIEEGRTWRVTEVAKLSSILPVDNFEGLAIEPREDGRLNVWLIADDNRSAFQRSLLWRLTVDPAQLPWPGATDPKKRARGVSARLPS